MPTLVTISGNLRDAYRQIQPGTMLHADELMNARRTSTDIQQSGFYTADGIIYFRDGNTPKIAITREEDNLVLRHIDEAFAQLTATRKYLPGPREAQTAIHATRTEIFDLTKLSLKDFYKQDIKREYGSLEISTTEYGSLNPEQRRLAERVYGRGNDFIANMAMLKQEFIHGIIVYVLNPKSVWKEARESPIGQASWLCNYSINSNFETRGRFVNPINSIRGVPRETPPSPLSPPTNFRDTQKLTFTRDPQPSTPPPPPPPGLTIEERIAALNAPPSIQQYLRDHPHEIIRYEKGNGLELD